MKIKYFVRADTMVQHLRIRMDATTENMQHRDTKIQELENPPPGLIIYQGQAEEIKGLHYQNSADRERLLELNRTIIFLKAGDAGQLVDVTEEI